MAVLIQYPEMSIAPQIVKNPNPNLSKLYSFRPYTKKGTLKAIGSNREMKISCKVKELGVLNVGLDQNVKKSSRLSKEDEEKQNYYVNLGYAIRTLREEFPDLFYKELSFDIYRDDIVFKDPLNTFMGIENYKSIFWALRFHGRIFFKALWIDISTVWQPVEDIIMIRWTVHGIPRVPWESRGRFDGTSVYKLDKQGKIYEHRVDNIALNSPPKFKVLGVEELIRSVGCPSTPKPTYFEVSSTTERT
ncbi:hypothetical protein HN51_021040 [Arachis hypogaea]|uniref:uncharacterized protein n=1 Tax=Arachis hypogaea TaxID=3818 RepID=UPI000DECAC6F|nr:uncharacterized protein LOC112732999 [Arachis hypogaea]QHO51954.1 uncharacterized protein DS421_2g35340 [Arachis hypogaea]